MTATAEQTPLLEVRGVSKYFGNVIALKDISVAVNAGEVTCVLGDNGAGKSSFIKILSGVHPHDDGRVPGGGRGGPLQVAARCTRARGSPRCSRTWPRCR